MRRFGPIVILLSLTAALGCGVTQSVRPVGQGGLRAELSLGGPLLDIGAVIPAPITMVGARYGVLDRMDVHARWNALLAAFGAFGMDAGVSGLVYSGEGWIPGISAGGLLTLVTDAESTNVYPEFTVAVSWEFLGENLVYFGLTNFYQFAPFFQYHPAPFIGGRWQATSRFGVSLEVKWISPHRDTTYSPVSYVSPGQLGAFSILLGFDVDILHGGA